MNDGLKGKLLLNERLAKYTSWRVGGIAERLYIPHDRDDLIAFIKGLPADEPVLWMGLGSNLLVRDGGIRGTVVNTKSRLKTMHLTDEGLVYVEAGVPCAHIARFCAEKGLVGAEFLAGIPGTMGGALRMNAGAFGGETWPIVKQVDMLSAKGEITKRQKSEFSVAYRSVKGFNDEWFLSALLELPKGDTAASQQKIKELLEQRARTQPTNQPSCGSVYKNPPGNYAAKLIEQCGLKGYAIGGACVSPKHANFIVNTGQASADDIEKLMSYVQRQVLEQHGVALETEVCMVGQALENGVMERSWEDKDVHLHYGRVAVLMGGSAAERPVSLRSGAAVFEALKNKGVDVIAIDVTASPIDALADVSVERVFNIIHGRGGEDGVLQGVLEVMGIPYTGSGVLASALAMDKLRTKLCWQGFGLVTPLWQVLKEVSDVDTAITKLGFPMIVKPSQEGSSIGMSKAHNRDELLKAFEVAAEFNCDVYAERWVSGKEYTVGILNGEALPVIRLETPRSFYDYEAKYNATTTQYHCPCGLPSEDELALQKLAVTAAEVVDVKGWARVDVFIDDSGQYQLIEINTVPGMTDHSLVPMAAKQAGIPFDELVLRILDTSLA
jgi:D-alanine-D-alanine ligase